MRQQVVDSESTSDDDSTMADDVKIVIHINPKHVKKFLSSDLLATTAHKNRWEEDTKTKKRPANGISTPAKKPRQSEKEEKDNSKWKCAICTHVNVHVKSAHEDEGKNDKTRKSTEWQCVICDKSYYSKGNLQRHVRTAHSTKKNPGLQCSRCPKKYTTKENLNRHVKTHSVDPRKAAATVAEETVLKKDKENISKPTGKVHSDAPPREVAPVTEKTVHKKDKENISKQKGKVHSDAAPKGVAPVKEKTVLKKDKENISNEKEKVHPVAQDEKTGQMKDAGKKHSSAPLKEVAPLRENTGVIKVTSTETPKVPVTKFTKYECRCGKTENTYDASVRHAQEHLVELEALIRKNGSQYELKFDRHNRGNKNNHSLIQTKFDYRTLLKDSWFNMFKPTDLSSTILASSLYKYTRCVKLNWDSEKKEEREGHCVPLYKCGACDLFVEPAKVQIHCENDRTCVVCKPQGHECPECQKYFYTHKAMTLHMEDHYTYKNLRFRIVTFNNEDDVQFNKALRQMSLLSVGNVQTETQEKLSGSPETTERIVLEKNVHNNEAIRVSKYCVQCKRSYSDLEDHSAYHENKSKRIMETIVREQQRLAEVAEATAEKQNGKTEINAEPEENVSDNDNIRKDKVQAPQHNDIRMAIDSESSILEWNSDCDSDDDDQQSQAQLNFVPKHFGRIITKKSEIKQRTDNLKKLQGNRKNDDDAVIGEHDQLDQCELTLGRIFREFNDGVDTLESDNESQSTEDLQRVLEGDAESVLSDDE